MKQSKSVLICNSGGAELNHIKTLLEAEDCRLFTTSMPFEAVQLLQRSDTNIDIILACQDIGGMNGQEFKRLIEKIRPDIRVLFFPVTCKEKASQPETMSSCSVNMREFARFVHCYVKEKTNLAMELSRFKDFFISFTDRLFQVFNINSGYFYNNDYLVARLSMKVAMKMGLEEGLVEAVHMAGLLHNIGKVGVPLHIIGKEGRLEDGEFTVIKGHPANTAQLLRQANFPLEVEAIVASHHEHYDSNGYPDGLKGRQIPVGSRIIAVVDSYVAMTRDRPYRKALSHDETVKELIKKAGSQFDPEIVEFFLPIIQEEVPYIAGKKRILVLDREESTTALIKFYIDSDEFEVFGASSPSMAARVLKEKNPCLIIADSGTLGMDKFQFFNATRKDDATSAIPFIIIVPQKDLPRRTAGPLVDFMVKPLNMEQLLSKISSISEKEGPVVAPSLQPSEKVSGISGNLEEFCLTDIIQILIMGLKTAKIILLKERKEGLIYIHSGKMVYVSVGRERGEEAFLELMGWERGVFHIFHGQTAPGTNVATDTMALLLETSRLLDEKRKKGQRPGYPSSTAA